jgi:3-hydroxyisobutyrate dehydrogenase-like beta-hydroxyacid dehydrogenase
VTIALIGYGEVGRILAEDLRAAGHDVAAFDVKLESGAGAAMRAHALAHGVALAATHAGAVAGAELVLCAVTADQTLAAAEACAGALPRGAFFLDLNSASPNAKIAAAAVVEAGGGRYVEGAVMTAVPPYRLEVPLLLGGPHAEALAPTLAPLGFAGRVASERLGIASATKMCRSVIIKGLEAMVIESLTAARHYGVEDAVVASLGETFPSLDWERQAAYFFQRVIEHGRRRSEEMREAALTVRDAGLDPRSASGTAELQAWMAELGEQEVFGVRGQPGFARSADWRTEADRILNRLNEPSANTARATATSSEKKS